MKALFGSSVKDALFILHSSLHEPSADVQISCLFAEARDAAMADAVANCRSERWIELLGCGMVDPKCMGSWL